MSLKKSEIKQLRIVITVQRKVQKEVQRCLLFTNFPTHAAYCTAAVRKKNLVNVAAS